MAPKTRMNPFGVDAARDLHHGPPILQIPGWSENCLFTGFDPANEVYFYHHLGRVANAPHYWQGDFCLALGDGRQLMQKTYGNSENANGMGDGTLHFECLEPFQSWRVTFTGITYLTDQDENRTRFLSIDLPQVPTEFDLRWEAIAPLYAAQSDNGGDIATAWDSHYEQGGVIRGVLRFGDTEIPLDGTGYRDHSVGARDLSRFHGHAWLNAVFPRSRRAFSTLNVDEGTSPAAKVVYVVIDGELLQAKYVSGPRWAPGSDDFEDKTFQVSLRAGGRDITIDGEVQQIGYYWTCMEPSQLNCGMDSERAVREKMWVCKEAVVKYTWDGETTYGNIEISRRLGSPLRSS